MDGGIGMAGLLVRETVGRRSADALGEEGPRSPARPGDHLTPAGGLRLQQWEQQCGTLSGVEGCPPYIRSDSSATLSAYAWAQL